MLGLNTAVSAIVANNFGAKNYDRIFDENTQVVKIAYNYIIIESFIFL